MWLSLEKLFPPKNLVYLSISDGRSMQLLLKICAVRGKRGYYEKLVLHFALLIVVVKR